jgi:hypothetical protein
VAPKAATAEAAAAPVENQVEQWFTPDSGYTSRIHALDSETRDARMVSGGRV